MQPGNFVKWSSSDAEGKFFHVGELLALTEKRAQIQCAFGVIDVALTDGEVKVTKKIDLVPVASFTKAEMDELGASTTKPKADVVEKPKVVRAKRAADGGPSKQDLAVEIVKNNPQAKRQELIQMIMDQLKMSTAGASTYVYNAQKALGLK